MRPRGFSMVAVATIVVLSAAIAFAENDSSFQIRYASNLTGALANNTVINMSNTGASWGTVFATPGGTLIGNGTICVNIYVTSPDEQLQWCCQCTLSPNALGSASAQADFIFNTLTGVTPKDIVIKLVATVMATGGGVCDATTAGQIGDPRFGIVTGQPLALGLVAWARGNGAETPFSNGSLSTAELSRITSFCAFNKTQGSGKGYCGTNNFKFPTAVACPAVGL